MSREIFKMDIMKILKLFFIIIGFVTIFAACEGPEGPQGPSGKDGNANVKTDTASITWAKIDDNIYKFVFNTTFITQDILSKGSIIVSVSNDKSSWIQLPTYAGGYAIYYWFNIGSITITINNTAGGSFDNSFLYKYIKVLIIAGD